MDLTKAIKNRRSVRKYQARKIPKKIIREIIDIAKYSPSANNRQPWKFVVITDKEYMGKLSGAIKKKMDVRYPRYRLGIKKDPILHNAPTLVIICGPKDKWANIDCVITSQTMMLYAYSIGIASCWMGFVKEFLESNKKEAKKIGVPNNYSVHVSLVFGYPDVKPIIPLKKTPEIIKWF